MRVMAMGDRIVVMSAAVVQQVGAPAEVYYDPANLFVARFIGSPGMNLIKGQYQNGQVILPRENRYTVPADWRPTLDKALNGAGEVILGFRPESGTVEVQHTENLITADVYASDMHGGFSMLHLDIGAPSVVHVRANRHTDFLIGERVRFGLDPAMVRFFHPQGELAIRREGN